MFNHMTMVHGMVQHLSGAINLELSQSMLLNLLTSADKDVKESTEGKAQVDIMLSIKHLTTRVMLPSYMFRTMLYPFHVSMEHYLARE